MAIVKELVEAHDGEIGYAAPDDSGSLFYFELPSTEPDVDVSSL